MGTVVGVVESDGGMLEESILRTTASSFSSAKQIGNPVVYKLVRVEGDGRLVPATDEEIMEVKDLLENKNDMSIVTDTGQTLGFISDEGLSSGLPQLESSEGLSQSDSREAGADKLNSRHQEPIPLSTKDQNRCSIHQPMKVGQCSKPTGSSKEAASSPAVQRPDFSRLRGEICLDNLSIKELQETFRATFGRETTVKDKLWLKRRIAMGLNNSCVVSATSFTIKDNKLVGGQEEIHKNVSDACSKDATDEGRADNCKDAKIGSSGQVKGHHSAYDQSPRDHFRDHACGGEDFIDEQRAAKRVRKPTRRYIEELSETDEKLQSGKSMNPSKDRRLAPKSQLEPIRAVSLGRRVDVTRMVSLAGSRIQVPFVSQVRRSRPRVNIMALVDFHPSYLEAKATPAENSQCLAPPQLNSDKVDRSHIIKSTSKRIQEEFATGDISRNSKQHSGSISIEVHQDVEPQHSDSFGNSSFNNHVSSPIRKGAFRRKHHRAWTLSEVMKLVDGVSKFGVGKWSEIRRLSFASYSYRTSVDLKDKWRNLLKACFAQTPADRKGGLRKHGSIPIPTQILLRVRELAEKQSKVRPVSNAVRDRSRRVDKGRTGFL